MIVEGTCRKCTFQFDAHWHNYPKKTALEAIMNPYCPYCKSLDVVVTTDEEFESPTRDDYEENDL